MTQCFVSLRLEVVQEALRPLRHKADPLVLFLERRASLDLY